MFSLLFSSNIVSSRFVGFEDRATLEVWVRRSPGTWGRRWTIFREVLLWELFIYYYSKRRKARDLYLGSVSSASCSVSSALLPSSMVHLSSIPFMRCLFPFLRERKVD